MVKFLNLKTSTMAERENNVNNAKLAELVESYDGYVHGQYYGLLRLFKYGCFQAQSDYPCLIDYVDREKQSLETISLLLAYKIKFPENFFFLWGNHEYASINRTYGFYDACTRRYTMKIWKALQDCFNCWPVAAIDLASMEQIRRVMRPTDVPNKGLLCDLLWSDPDKDVMSWGRNEQDEEDLLFKSLFGSNNDKLQCDGPVFRLLGGSDDSASSGEFHSAPESPDSVGSNDMDAKFSALTEAYQWLADKNQSGNYNKSALLSMSRTDQNLTDAAKQLLQVIINCNIRPQNNDQNEPGSSQ